MASRHVTVTSEDLPGFWINITPFGRAYIPNWECCTVSRPSFPLLPSHQRETGETMKLMVLTPLLSQCTTKNKIWDRNYNWTRKIREPCGGKTADRAACRHDRCDYCFDVTPVDERIRRCGGGKV